MQVARNSVKGGFTTTSNESKENLKLKVSLESLEKERDELKAKIKKFLEDPTDKLPTRTRKEYSDGMTKLQLKVFKKFKKICLLNFMHFRK